MRTSFAETLIPRLCEAKIQDPHRSVRQQHDVTGFQIAMNDSSGVCGLQTFSDLSRDLQALIDWQGSVALQTRSKSLPFVQRHRQEEPAPLGRTDFVDDTKIGMIERCGRVSFPLKPRFGGWVEVVMR
jgi:hypothetical protein